MSNNDTRITELAKLWVSWNIKTISGNQFASTVKVLFKKEIDKAWKDYLNRKVCNG